MRKGSRKFIIAGGALIFGFVLAIFGKLSADFVTLAMGCVGTFTAGNAYEHSRQSGAAG